MSSIIHDVMIVIAYGGEKITGELALSCAISSELLLQKMQLKVSK